MKYLKKFNESDVTRNYSIKALTNGEDTYIMTLGKFRSGLGTENDMYAHWVKNGYYDKNTNAFTSDPMGATHVWIKYKPKKFGPFRNVSQNY